MKLAMFKMTRSLLGKLRFSGDWKMFSTTNGKFVSIRENSTNLAHNSAKYNDGGNAMIINLTPHTVNFITDAGNIEIPASGNIARVSTKTEITNTYMGIPMTKTVYGDVVGLPEPTADTIFIVSTLVAQRVPDRNDVFIPNEPVRNEHGVIIGCKSLGRI